MRTSGREVSRNIDDRRRQGLLARRNIGMVGRASWADPRGTMRDYLMSPETLGEGVWYSAYGVDSAIASTPNYKLQRERIAREQMDYLVSGYDSAVFGPSTATVNLVADASPAFTRHIQQQADAGAVSSNIEDRRSSPKPVARSFEFDGTTVWLDVSRPDGSIMSDEEAVKAYKDSGSNLGTSWQPYWQNASTSPTYNFSSPVSHNLTDDNVATLTRTLLGEAVGDGVPGMTAVANVINNRSLSNGLYPANPVDVALQPYQFSTWNSANMGGNQDMVLANYPPGSAEYQLAEAIVRRTFIEGTMPDNTGGSLNYHVTGITNAWIRDLEANAPYGSVQIGNQTFYPQHPIPPMSIPDVGSLIDARNVAGGVAAPPMPQPRPEPGAANPAVYRALQAMGGVNSDVAVSPYVNWSGQIVSRETIPVTSAEIDDQLYGMIAPQTPALDPVGAGPGTWGDFTKAMSIPLPAPAPLKPGEVKPPPPRPRPDVTAEGLAIRKVTTVAIGPDGNPVVNAPQPVPVAGRPVVDDRSEAIRDARSGSLPATVPVRQIGTVPVIEQKKSPDGRVRTPDTIGNVAIPRDYDPGKSVRPMLEPLAAPTVGPATKAIMNDVSKVGAARKLADVGSEPPVITMGTKTTQVTEWIENPAYAKWLETYGSGGANVSGSPDDRDERSALGKAGMAAGGAAGPSIVPPPPPATIAVTRNKTTTVRTVAEPKPVSNPVVLNSRGQQVVKVLTTRYDPDLNDWVPVEKYVPVEKAVSGALPAGSAVAPKPKNNGGGGGGSAQSSASGAQYVRQKDGSALKQVTGTIFNYETQQFETRTHYVSA